jgi:methionine aminopeptidase
MNNNLPRSERKRKERFFKRMQKRSLQHQISKITETLKEESINVKEDQFKLQEFYAKLKGMFPGKTIELFKEIMSKQIEESKKDLEKEDQENQQIQELKKKFKKFKRIIQFYGWVDKGEKKYAAELFTAKKEDGKLKVDGDCQIKIIKHDSFNDLFKNLTEEYNKLSSARIKKIVIAVLGIIGIGIILFLMFNA